MSRCLPGSKLPNHDFEAGQRVLVKPTSRLEAIFVDGKQLRLPALGTVISPDNGPTGLSLLVRLDALSEPRWFSLFSIVPSSIVDEIGRLA